jgi:hypothetical protein
VSGNDTAPETEAVLNDLLRRAPVWRKLRALGQLNAMAKALALSDLRERHPHATGAELQRLLADRILGEEVAAVVYGPRSQAESEEEAADVI